MLLQRESRQQHVKTDTNNPLLQVPLGSVTPLAVANPEAADVVLLLDAKVGRFEAKQPLSP